MFPLSSIVIWHSWQLHVAIQVLNHLRIQFFVNSTAESNSAASSQSSQQYYVLSFAQIKLILEYVEFCKSEVNNSFDISLTPQMYIFIHFILSLPFFGVRGLDIPRIIICQAVKMSFHIDIVYFMVAISLYICIFNSYL